MASEIHKKRTGKGFKISEEIVIKEEMYEEEEDDLPRQFRGLTSHLPSSSPAMANRLNAYVSTQVAMHSALAAREQEIEKQFAAQFPEYQASLSRGQQSMYVPPYNNVQRQSSPTTSHFSPRYSMDATSHSPTSAMGPTSIQEGTVSASLSSPDSPFSDQTPLAQSPQSQNEPTNTMVYPVSTLPPMSTSKYFTSELPNEVKQLANLDWNDQTTPALYGFNGSLMDLEATAGTNFNWTNLMEPTTTTLSIDESTLAKAPALAPDYFNNTSHPITHHLTLPGGDSTIGTPGGGAGGDPWDIWIDSDSYGPDGADQQ